MVKLTRQELLSAPPAHLTPFGIANVTVWRPLLSGCETTPPETSVTSPSLKFCPPAEASTNPALMVVAPSLPALKERAKATNCPLASIEIGVFKAVAATQGWPLEESSKRHRSERTENIPLNVRPLDGVSSGLVWGKGGMSVDLQRQAKSDSGEE